MSQLSMPTSSSPKPKRPRRHSSKSNTNSVPPKSEILINVYDLLPPGRLATALWYLGSSLLHTGVHVRTLSREYAFGGHDRPGMSGVYWTRPGTEPPGGTFRCELLHGFTYQPQLEMEKTVREASQRFLGQNYSLLTNNCNHFTSYLCEKLTGQEAPAWLNRAASIGVALPCVVPREWISPPEGDAEGELVEDEEEDERVGMLREEYRRARSNYHEGSEGGTWDGGGSGKRKGMTPLRDEEGVVLPASERAPGPH